MSAADNSTGRTIVTIDRLVLRGVDPHHAQALAESLKQQLARTLSEPAHRQQLLNSSDTPVLRLGRMPLTSGRAGARAFGVSLARAIGAQARGTRATAPRTTRAPGNGAKQ